MKTSVLLLLCLIPVFAVGSEALKCKNFNCMGGRCTMREKTCKSGEVCYATGGQPHGCIAEEDCLKLKKELSQNSKLTVVCCKKHLCNL